MDPKIARAAVRMIQRIREPGDGIKWVPTDNLHLTLKFLGDVHNTDVPNVCKAIRDTCLGRSPFELQFLGAGGLPATERTRVVYAGVVDSSGSLTAIVENLEKELARIGFKPEPRDYRPHLTLGRAKNRRASGEVIRRIQKEQAAETELGSMTVDRIQMIASFLDKGGPTYQVMDTLTL